MKIDTDNLWTRADILKYFRISNSTWLRWKKKFKIKPLVKRGNITIYLKEEIMKILKIFEDYQNKF